MASLVLSLLPVGQQRKLPTSQSEERSRKYAWLHCGENMLTIGEFSGVWHASMVIQGQYVVVCFGVAFLLLYSSIFYDKRSSLLSHHVIYCHADTRDCDYRSSSFKRKKLERSTVRQGNIEN